MSQLNLADLVSFLLASFACFRLAQFVVYDDAPGGLMLRLRIRAGVYDYGDNGEPQSRLARLLSCPHCVGLWIALGLAICLFWQRLFVLLPAWWAIAGLQSFLERRA